MPIDLAPDEVATITRLRELPRLYPELEAIWDPERAILCLRRECDNTWIELSRTEKTKTPQDWLLKSATWLDPDPLLDIMELTGAKADPCYGRGVATKVAHHFGILRPVWRKAPPKTPICPYEDVLPGAKPNPDLIRFCTELRKLGLLAEVELHPANPKSGPQKLIVNDFGLDNCSIRINEDGDAEFCNSWADETSTHDGLTWPLESDHLPAAIVVYLLHAAGGDPVRILRSPNGVLIEQV